MWLWDMVDKSLNKSTTLHTEYLFLDLKLRKEREYKHTKQHETQNLMLIRREYWWQCQHGKKYTRFTSINRPRHLYSPCQVQCRLLRYPIWVIEEQYKKVPHRRMLCRFSAEVPWNAKIVSDPSLTASGRGSSFVLLLSLLAITCNKVNIWELCA